MPKKIMGMGYQQRFKVSIIVQVKGMNGCVVLENSLADRVCDLEYV